MILLCRQKDINRQGVNGEAWGNILRNSRIRSHLDQQISVVKIKNGSRRGQIT